MEQSLATKHLPSLNFHLSILKRTVDIVVSFILIIILFPVFLLLGVLIRAETDGPVFYKTFRVGRNLKSFILYKFRTMHDGSKGKINNLMHFNLYRNSQTESEPIFVKFENDERVTKIGFILRVTHFDELPQLFNVLKGDMSLVGNRPLELYEVQRLLMRGETLRFAAPAGMTGLWQVRQYRLKGLCELERIKLDNFYATHQSIAFDLSIALKTTAVIFRKIWRLLFHHKLKY